jgi:hypothetical protein
MTVTPPQPARPLALFGCTHGELYVPPLPLPLPSATASAAQAASPPAPRSVGSLATLASRMRAMGWKVDLLTDLERQLLPPPPAHRAPATPIVVVVLAAPSRRFSRAELRALRRWLLERGGRLWLLAEGADPAGPSPSPACATNLWRRFAAPLLGAAPREGEAVARLAPWPAAPPLLARAAAAALEVAAAAGEEEEKEERDGGGGSESDDGDLSTEAAVRRAVAALRRVRRAAATSGLCLHPRHALVGSQQQAAPPAGGGPRSSDTVLNRSVARVFQDADDGGLEPNDSFVFANGCPLDVFVEAAGSSGGGGGGAGNGAAATAAAGVATPLLASGRQCYPMDRPLMAAWEQHDGNGRALVVGSAAMFSDAWLGGSSSSSSSGGGSASAPPPPPPNRCDGNRRLADWCLRWLSAASSPPSGGQQDESVLLQLDAADGAAARAAMGVARKTAGRQAAAKPAAAARPARPLRRPRPPHALLPAIGALASRVDAAVWAGADGQVEQQQQQQQRRLGPPPAAAAPLPPLPAVPLPPAGALRARGGGGDWRAALDTAAFGGVGPEDGDDAKEEETGSLDAAAALAARRLVRPLA